MIKQYKIIIFVCALAIFCNIFAKFSLIAEQNKNIIILQKVIAAARSGSSIKSDMPGMQVSTSAKDLKKIFHKIPQEFSFTEYVSKLRALVDLNDLVVEKTLIFRPEKIKKSDLLKYNTNIAVTGEYIKIKKFIVDILNLPGLVYFDSVNLSRDKDNKNKVIFKFKLSLFFKRGVK